MANKKILTVIGATVAASLCCVTPVLAVLAGSSSLASSFSWLAPYHNYLVAFTVLVLIYAWYDKLKPSKDIECACDEENFFAGKTFLAIVTVFTFIMLTFPQWGSKVFDSAPSAESCSTGTCSSGFTSHKETTAVVLPVLKTQSKHKSCDTGTSCSGPKEHTALQKTNVNKLPVLQYMGNEKNNPTPYKQVACSGTGMPDLDNLITKKKKFVDEMPPPILKKMIENEDDFILLDVREASHKDGGEIEGFESYSLTYGRVLFNVLKDIQDKNTVVVVYSKKGLISLFATATLKELGYKNVYSLKGGVDAWKIAGYPYTKTEE